MEKNFSVVQFKKISSQRDSNSRMVSLAEIVELKIVVCPCYSFFRVCVCVHPVRQSDHQLEYSMLRRHFPIERNGQIGERERMCVFRRIFFLSFTVGWPVFFFKHTQTHQLPNQKLNWNEPGKRKSECLKLLGYHQDTPLNTQAVKSEHKKKKTKTID